MIRRPFLAAVFACVASVALVALAYVDQKILYEKASAYSTIVVTEEAHGVRVLRFGRDGARQSVVKLGDPDHLALPYARVALVGLALAEEPRRFLVVGLGGGTLPMFLRKYYPNAIIDAVDIDAEVVEVAKKFFGFREDELMKAHVGDGRGFIEKVRDPYDVIFLDAFGSDSIPPHLATQEFLQAVRRAVTPGGVVVGNLWGRSANPLYDSMVRTYQEVFDELLILDVRGAGNMILLALPRKQPLSRDELAQLARKVSAAKRFSFDLGDPVKYGFPGAHAKTPHGRVLRDADLGQRQQECMRNIATSVYSRRSPQPC
ncbi:MAG: fused MFS/spermidine synthase [Betaproteobacteria bacterium]|nr:fused MFS/spermidine synthase [Betaproteobacteria bacterium]